MGLLESEDLDRRHYIVFLINFTEVLGFSIVLPVLPFLGLSLGLNEFEIGIVLAIFSAAQFIASPVTGKLSDRFGRRPVLLISQTSTFLGFVILGFANTVFLLVLARVVDGLFGSNRTLVQSVLSDITPPEKRTKIYGYSSAVFGGGLIFGPVIGGILGEINFSIPMFLSAGITLVSIILVIFFLPETMTQTKDVVRISIDDILPIKEAKTYFRTSPTKELLMLFLIYSIAFTVFITNFTLFGENHYSVTSREIGLGLGLIGILRVIMQTLMIEPLIERFGEETTLQMGIGAMILSMLTFAIPAIFWIAIIPLTLLSFGTGVSRPILTSALSNSAEETGSVMGVNNSLGSISRIFTPIAGGAILTYLPAYLLPLVAGGIYLIMILPWRGAWDNIDGLTQDKKIIRPGD